MEYKNYQMEKLLWIVGRWENTGGETKSIEHWKKINGSLYEGGSETIKNGEVIFSEKLKIHKIGEEIFYIADVKHNPAPVMFKLASLNDNCAVFENPEHDFPKKITYKNENSNLHAWIEGPGKNGDLKKIDFYFNKIKT
jgi:hypothetical protein